MITSKRKILIITLLFLILLTGVRLLWITLYSSSENPKASQGILDLRSQHSLHNAAYSLDGEWEFYPNLLINTTTAESLIKDTAKKYIQVPGNWSTFFKTDSDDYQYGTYRLRILTSNSLEQTYAVWISSIQTASKLYVNDNLLSTSGFPAEDFEHFSPGNVPYAVTVRPETNEIEIIIQVANTTEISKGGITKSIMFGGETAINKKRLFSLGMQLMVSVILLLHGFYAGIIYIINRNQRVMVYLFLLVVSAGISILLDDDQILLTWFPLPFEWALRFTLLAYSANAAFLLMVTREMFPEYKKIKLINGYLIICGLYSIILLFASTYFIISTSFMLVLLMAFSSVAVPLLIMKLVLKEQEDTILLLLTATGIASSIIWGFIKATGFIKIGYYPFDMLAALLGFAAYWFKRYFQNADQMIKLAKRLQKADKTKDEFLANTSHELRTPLHGIITIAQSILERPNPSSDAKNKKDLELLITIGWRMSYMVNDLLDLTQLRENRIRLQLSSIRITSIAGGVLDMLRFLKDGKPIEFTMDIPDHFPKVIADEKRLTQIMFNLLHNAMKYTNEGIISVHAEVRGSMVHIHIADTGIGMDEETRNRVFQPYEQGNPDALAAEGGIGLGLSITHKLIDLHGGEMYVHSVPQKGSTFSFSLPMDVSGATDSSERQLPSAAVTQMAASSYMAIETNEHSLPLAVSARPKILAVDDDPINLKILGNILNEDYYQVELAGSGEEALIRLGEEQWDLIIADVMMPSMSGYELTQRIRERYSLSELPVLLLTARNSAEDIYFGFRSGANDYVTKPVDTTELRFRVRSLTDLKKSVFERLSMEAAYLQAQIQPHFLFNTLNSISALSDIDTLKMQKLIDAFSSYLRISYDFLNATPYVSIKHELELVQAYLYIEKERFEERLEVVWEIDGLLHFQLPPLTIQPLVENAVKHGILSRFKGGTLSIGISNHQDCTEITIADNGIGMNDEQVSRLLDGQNKEQSGIGLLNTDRRLKQLYGKGLHIVSKPNQGTTVSFIIPNKSADNKESDTSL
jgi:sensor histidine kinase YesM